MFREEEDILTPHQDGDESFGDDPVEDGDLEESDEELAEGDDTEESEDDDLGIEEE